MTTEIELKLVGNDIVIDCLDFDYLNGVYKNFEFYVKSYRFMPAYKSGSWNGKKSVFRKGSRKLPFGLLNHLFRYTIKEWPDNKLTIDDEIKNLFKPRKIYSPVYDLKFQPYWYQAETIDCALKNGKGLFKLPTASGKSLVIAYILKTLLPFSDQQLIIVPNIGLIQQFYNDLIDYGMSKKLLGKVNSKLKEFDKAIVVSTWQTLAKNPQELDRFNTVIVDECLHPDTPILTKTGNIKIENLKKGDLVLTLNEKTKKYEYNHIEKVHKNLSNEKVHKYVSKAHEKVHKYVSKMYRIETETGELLITENHKVYTQRDWVRVDNLTLSDEIIDIFTSTKILSIEKISYTGDTYNLHVKNNHNYFANGYCVSNCHSSKAAILFKTLQNMTPDYKFGFTGTMPNDDLSNLNVQAYIGPVLKSYTNQEISDGGYIAKGNINVINITYKADIKGDYNAVIEETFTQPFRINIIRKIISEAEGSVLLLVGKVENEGDVLRDHLANLIDDGKELVFLSGRDDVEIRSEFQKKCHEQDNLVLIATYGIFQAGINIKSLKDLVLVSSYKSNIRVIQSVGRTLRMYVNKKESGALIWDLVDQNKFGKDHSKKRQIYYNQEGFSINEIDMIEGKEDNQWF